MIGDWISTRLTGAWSTDPSLGSSSGMFDLARRTWSPRIADLCGVDARILPDVALSGTIAGSVTTAASNESGLRCGTPVVVGGADTQLALVGLAQHDVGDVTIVGGTFWQHTTLVDAPVIDPESRLRTLCHVLEDRWMIEGIGFWSGLAARWFRDGFGPPEVVAGSHGADAYDLLEAEAAAVGPGANGVDHAAVERDERQPLGARPYGIRRFRSDQSVGDGSCGVLSCDRGVCGVRRPRPHPTPAGHHEGRARGPRRVCRRRIQGTALATGGGRRPRHRGDDPSRQGGIGAWCCNRRRRRSRPAR